MENLFNKASFKTSELITRLYSTSFYRSVKLLSPEMREAIYSIYGFVRVADEIVDTFHSSNQEQILDNFYKSLQDALSQGVSTNPVLHSFLITVRRYNIPQDHIQSFMNSMRADLTKKIYRNASETDAYIYGSAKVIGLMCLRVFVNGDNELYEKLEKPSMKLGSAFQKVNFLRDLKTDYNQLNRTYFPDFEIATFNEEKKTKIIKDIEEDFQESIAGIKQLPGKSKLAVWLAYSYYLRLLKKINRTPPKKLMEERIRVNNLVKYLLLLKAYFIYQFKLI